MTYNIKVLCESADLMPVKLHNDYTKYPDSGWDLLSAENVSFAPGERKLVSTGIRLDFPDDHYGTFAYYEGQIRPRSGLTKKGIDVAFGTIDSGYRGTVFVNMTNNSNETYFVTRGQRICQLVISLVPRVHLVSTDEICVSTDRGTNGFGSTGH